MIISQLVAGDTLSRTWTLLQSSGAPVNLTGSSASFGLISIPNNVSVLQASTTDGSGDLTIPLPPTGSIQLKIAPSVTAALAPGVYQCALRVTFIDGSKGTYDIEQLTILPQIAL